MSNGIEDQLVDSFVGEENKFLDLFSPDRMKELFGSFKELWQDPDKRVEYETLKGDLGEKYMTDPAKFLGFIEESPDMHKDVISAAEETGVDPEFLYNVGMQEGMAEQMEMLYKQPYFKEITTVHPTSKHQTTKRVKMPLYESDRPMDTYKDIGLDAMFLEQDEILNRGYLKNPIEPIGEVSTKTNEAGLKIPTADISSKDAWRGTGALIQLNKDYLVESFNKVGADFNSLPKEKQQFWTYASFNAGPGTAEKLLKAYGSDPFKNPDFVKRIEIYNTTEDDDLFSKHENLGEWMKNVGRVVGGTELTNLYSPFSGELYK